MKMNQSGFALTAAALVMLGVTGCATKNYVRTQTGPLIDHTAQLDQKTAENNRAINDVNDRAQAGISKAQGSADQATQNAQTATQAANTADAAANDVAHRADSLDSVVKGLDNYKQVANVSVNFGFDKSVLTADDKQQLDDFAGHLGSAKSYILEVTGGTDSDRVRTIQLRSEPAPGRFGGAIPGSEVQHRPAPVLSHRHRQGPIRGR